MTASGPPNLRDVVRRCFFATHAGHSTDDVVIDDDLNAAFIAACLREVAFASPADLKLGIVQPAQAASGDRQGCDGQAA
jgi:hypothetical protein